MFVPTRDMIESSRRFEKKGVLDCFMNQKIFGDTMLRHGAILYHPPGAYDAVHRSPPLADLREIGLRDLVSRMHRPHRGRVLYGTLSVDPLKLAVLQTVLEDTRGGAVAVSVTNFGDADEFAAKFSNGQKVALKEPYLQENGDGRYSLRVNNPDDVVAVDSFPAPEPSPGSSSTREKTADELRSEGNAMFVRGQYRRAIQLYTESIERLPAVAEDADKELTSGKLLLCYSNRAEAWLRLDMYDNALSDSLKALEQDAGHEKSMLRKGKSLLGLQLYTEAAACLRQVLVLNTPGVNVQRTQIENLISQADPQVQERKL